MAYDPVKAHEYYINYRKKGLKKGRKKGKGKAAKTPKSSLVGLGTAGLNDAGKMQWAMLKKELNEQMNAELDGVTDIQQRKDIISKYQNQALAALQKIKADPSYATPKKTRASSGGSSSKKSSGGSSSSSSSSKSSNSSKDDDSDNGSSSSSSSSNSNSSSSKLKTYSQHTAEIKKKGALQKGKKVTESTQESQEEKISRLANDAMLTLNTIINKADLQNATPDQKEQIRTLTENIIQKLESSGAPEEVLSKISALREQIGV